MGTIEKQLLDKENFLATSCFHEACGKFLSLHMPDDMSAHGGVAEMFRSNFMLENVCSSFCICPQPPQLQCFVKLLFLVVYALRFMSGL